MEVFTIVANEVIGLSATECTLMQFSYNPEQIHDPESVLRSAVMDYLKTDEGKRQLEILKSTVTGKPSNIRRAIHRMPGPIR